MLRLDDSAVLEQADVPAAAREIALALAELGRGDAHQLPKQTLPGLHDGAMHLSLAGAVPSLGVAVAKWASYVPGAAGEAGRSTSTVVVSDHATGDVLAIVEGMAATTLRTAAAVLAVAHRLASPPRSVALLGYGRVNQAVGASLAAHLPSIDEIRVATRSTAMPLERREGSPARFVGCATVAQACVGADLIVSATGATDPLADFGSLPPNAVVVSLDGARTWTGTDTVTALSDHDGSTPSLARAFAGDDAATLAGARFIDLGGCAVMDAAFCSMLIGARR